MKNSLFQPNRNLGGIPANRVIVPMILVLTALLATIIGLIYNINARNSELVNTMQDSSTYIEDATSLLGGSSLLSETMSTFVLMPVTGNGELNLSPLAGYASELLNTDRRPDQVLEKFQHYDVSDAAMDHLETAARSANSMLEAQLHALALVSSVYPLPDVPPVNQIPLQELTAEETTMPDQQKLGVARSMILGGEYGLNKKSVSENTSACTGIIKEEMGQKVAVCSQQVAFLRTALWAAAAAIVLLLAVSFLALYWMLLSPLGESARLITRDRPLDEGKGLQEVRLLAFAYNGLLRRRDALDNILRSAASTDALTGLPNRYGFEQYLLDVGEEDTPLAMILFDVNYLKRTNDNEGHAAGDKLLKNSAASIAACFGLEDKSNCFRFGGDEFVAVMKDVRQEELAQMGVRFREDQRKRGISVSWGCAYTETLRGTNFQALLDEADKGLYAQKRVIHAQDPDYSRTHNLA